MRRAAGLFAAVAVVATPALVLARYATPARWPLALDLYLLALGASIVVGAALSVRDAWPRGRRSALADALAADPPSPLRVAELERLQRELELAASNAFDFHFRLRPTLREIVAQRLLDRHGLRLDSGTAAVRRRLGDELWQVVRPDREPPARRHDAGPGLAALAALVERVEAL